MVRPPIDLELYKAQIIDLYQAGKNPVTIATILQEEHNVKAHARTLASRLNAWGIRKNNPRGVRREPAFIDRVKVLFSDIGLQDSEILTVLQTEGFEINARTLRRARAELGLVQRKKINPLQEQEETALRIISEKIKSGTIDEYDSELLFYRIRRMGLAVSRARFKQLYRSLVPGAEQSPPRDLQKANAQGPNEIWTVGKYPKLQPFGIEVYAAVDMFSRYTLWVYVGISAHAQVSIAREYLDTVKATRKVPRRIQSGQSTETGLLGETHTKLVQAQDPSVQNCYIHGAGTENWEIEAWWGQLSKELIFSYQEYFSSLTEEGNFSRLSIIDRIALYAIYMPILRAEIRSYTKTWNVHRFRKDPKRPTAICGKPYVNFHGPPHGVRNIGIPVNLETFESLHSDMQNHDVDEFLPEATFTWCCAKLLEMGFDPKHPPEIKAAEGLSLLRYRTTYLQFREVVSAHVDSKADPVLSLA